MRRKLLLGALSVWAVAAQAQCDWSNPGADRYTGTSEAAIAGMPLTPSQKDAATEAVSKGYLGAIDEVEITRDSIRSIRGTGRLYKASLRSMVFGASKRCASVDRSSWPADRVVSALVFDAGGEPLFWPSACGNWVLGAYNGRVTVTGPIPVAEGGGGGGSGPSGGVFSPPARDPGPSVVTFEQRVTYSPTVIVYEARPMPAYYWPVIDVTHVIRVEHFDRRHIPAVPEPQTWFLMLVGLAAVAWARWRRR